MLSAVGMLAAAMLLLLGGAAARGGDQAVTAVVAGAAGHPQTARVRGQGLCQPGQSESLLEAGETAPTGRMPINPSGGFVSFGEATTAMGVFQIAELTWQLRGQAGGRQVPDAKVGLAQTLGLGGNATAAILKR